jgi:hypothetical protein
MKENENNFESLRRLMALKRHETPPPGYFENFSSDVMARIRAGDAGQAESAARQLPWLFRLLSAFEAKPAFAGAFASALCLLLLFGIVFAERPDVAPQSLLQTAQINNSPLAVVTPGSLGIVAKPVGFDSLPTEQTALIPISSTNPVFNSQSAGPWFASQGATVQPVNFTFPGN